MLKKYRLEITVFLCGAALMALELLGSRLVAPYLGSTIYTWASLIGVILGAMSVGYWWGGKVADRGTNEAFLAQIIFLSGIWSALIVIVNFILYYLLAGAPLGIRLSSILASIFLFAIPAVLLGMVSPYAARLKLDSLTNSGRTVGNLYAISTLGSIAGTFAAGFFLVLYFRLNTILLSIAVLLALTAFLLSRRIPRGLIWIGIFLFAASILVSINFERLEKKMGIMAQGTLYDEVRILTMLNPAGRPVRFFQADPFSVQSGRYLDSEELLFEYTKYYHLLELWTPETRHSLMIGGAGYSFPQAYLRSYPKATIDVVEIDPGVTALAKRWFGLTADPRLKIIHEDGRRFLNSTTDSYDTIMIDAFRSVFAPIQLTTREAVAAMRSRLTDNGLVITNIIASWRGPKSRFFQAELATYREIFPSVYAIPTSPNAPDDSVQNITLLAFKKPTTLPTNPSERFATMLAYATSTYELDSQTVPFTDQYAPVELFTARAIQQ
ncbi:MAG: fused MFS/spermidine synthase [Candidatus Vogelbacteria bacterium]|nr:fused MFS/spermidine synthase [Candidatus Vogelbacteria bacterium]